MILTTFGSRIREARKRLNPKVTQSDLAERIGVSLQTVKEWEWGKKYPEFKRLLELVRILDVTPNWLLSTSVCQVQEDGTLSRVTFAEPEPEPIQRTNVQSKPLDVLHDPSLFADVNARKHQPFRVFGSVLDFPYAPEPVEHEPTQLSAANKTRKPQKPKNGKKPE